MPEERVVYYNIGDMCYGMGFSKISNMTIPDLSQVSINDALEYYEIHKYFEDGARLPAWSDEDYQIYEEKSCRLWELTNRFFSSLTASNLENEYSRLEIDYISDFWQLFDSCKLYERIEESVFARILICKHRPICEILQHKRIVFRYGTSIREDIIRDYYCIGLLIHYYEQKNNGGNAKIYLPDQLSGEDIVDLFDRYLDSDKVNTNYARSIFYMKNKPPKFPITDALRYKAQKQYKKGIEKASKNGINVYSSIGVSISKEQQLEKKVTQEGRNKTESYSYQWLCETLDFPSILNNFIYIFEYVDFQQMRCNHICIKKMGGIIERTFAPDSTQYYPENSAFHHANALASLQMKAYYSFLKDNGVRLEDVIQWFFTEYLQKEFGCPKMKVLLPSPESTLLEKCVSICTAIETVVKQFTQFASTGTINFDLLKISSASIKYHQIPSIIDGKYIYGAGSEYEALDYYLFSDQCPLYFASKVSAGTTRCMNFFSLFTQKTINISNFGEKYKTLLNKLADEDLISISDAGDIALGDQTKLFILMDLHTHEVISRWRYPESAQTVFQEWIDRGILREKSSLLSEPEANYFSYLLNNENYCNGLELRNQYSHGNGQFISNEKEHEDNYYVFLRVMTILAIKINDEFCLNDMLTKGTK